MSGWVGRERLQAIIPTWLASGSTDAAVYIPGCDKVIARGQEANVATGPVRISTAGFSIGPRILPRHRGFLSRRTR